MTQRIEPCFKYDSKNVFLIKAQRIEPFIIWFKELSQFLIWRNALNFFFFAAKNWALF